MQSKHVIAAIGIVSLLVACGRRQEAVTDTAGMADTGAMKGMAGMHGAMMDSMMPRMEAHMRMMDTASPATMQSMMTMHRQMADSMLTAMNDEMRRMNMTASAEWTATMDSLRQDLTRMSTMSANEFATFMPAHHARMMRLMQMHRTMRGKG